MNASATSHASSTASFDVPAGIDTGWSDRVVITNGIASDPIRTYVAKQSRRANGRTGPPPGESGSRGSVAHP